MPIFDEIRQEISNAEGKWQKVAMLHFQVLKHARRLAKTSPREFCRLVNLPESYSTEYQKMLSLARLMKEQGVMLARPVAAERKR